MKLRVIFSIVALALSGCVTPVKQTVPFDEAAFQWSTVKGSASIVGSAFLKTRAGDVKLGAGNMVELIPVTPYTKERFQIAAQLELNVPRDARDSRLAKYIHTTIADAQGSFEFRNIPAGEYVLSCVIQWQYGSELGVVTTGGQAIAFVSVADDETKKVVLTK